MGGGAGVWAQWTRPLIPYPSLAWRRLRWNAAVTQVLAHSDVYGRLYTFQDTSGRFGEPHIYIFSVQMNQMYPKVSILGVQIYTIIAMFSEKKIIWYKFFRLRTPISPWFFWKKSFEHPKMDQNGSLASFEPKNIYIPPYHTNYPPLWQKFWLIEGGRITARQEKSKILLFSNNYLIRFLP